MGRRTLVWLVPVFITLHNLEEALSVDDFVRAARAAMPAILQSFVPAVSSVQMLVALLAVTVLAFLLAGLAGGRRGNPGAITALLGLQVVMLCNVFAHLWMSAVAAAHTPGLLTALLINLPFSVYLLCRAYREEWVPRRAIAWLLPIGWVVHMAGIPLLLALAGRV